LQPRDSIHLVVSLEVARWHNRKKQYYEWYWVSLGSDFFTNKFLCGADTVDVIADSDIEIDLENCGDCPGESGARLPKMTSETSC
jgi:hypothetical protein